MFLKKTYITLLFLIFCNTTFAEKTPLVFTSSDDPISTISAAVLKEAYDKLGIEITANHLPSKRSLLKTNDGSLDGQLGRIQGIDLYYQDLMMVPVSINYTDAYIFTKDPDLEIHRWEDLKPFKIAVRRGVIFINNALKGMNVTGVENETQLFQMLNKNRADVIVVDHLIGLAELSRLKLAGIVMSQSPLEKVKLYHYLNKKHSSLIPELTKVLQQMENSGRIREIRKVFYKQMIKDFSLKKTK